MELSPCYVIEEKKLRQNLELISDVSRRADVEIILALKAFANWKVFPIIREYICGTPGSPRQCEALERGGTPGSSRQCEVLEWGGTTASSLWEARLSYEHFGGLTHTYSPAYESDTFAEILRYSSHITFNSLGQLRRFLPMVRAYEQSSGGHHVSVGLRINPEYSEIETELYNPCAPGSRFGVTAGELQSPTLPNESQPVGADASVSPQILPNGVEGLHFHCLCENGADALEHVLEHVEAKFGTLLDQAKWLNMGGGHLMTRKGYDIGRLVRVLNGVHHRHPNLHLIMEPGSAFLWQTGFLRSRVVDIVENSGIRTAVLNVSFTCHMPDCLEMPYQPTVRGAQQSHNINVLTEDEMQSDGYWYRLGGNSCLSGDWMGYWRFPRPLSIGDEIIFEDMIHYTTVKTNMFNGVSHPDLSLLKSNGEEIPLRQYHYEDYESRMD